MPAPLSAFRRALFAVVAWLAACAPAPVPGWADYGPPVPVAIDGYTGNTMEPFLSRDGTTLFFNDRNDPGDQTDLHWATRVSALRFRYRGRVAGANSPALDGVASMSRDGRFCFISPRAYDATLATDFCGDWRKGRLLAPMLQPDASPQVRGQVIFDSEIAADGRTMLLSQGDFSGGSGPASSVLRLARLREGSFVLSPADDRLFAALNADRNAYAAALSADGLTIAYTRAPGWGPFAAPSIWTARRTSPTAAFGAPRRIESITGFSEAPTFAPDGNTILFHHREGARLRLYAVRRRTRDQSGFLPSAVFSSTAPVLASTPTSYFFALLVISNE